MKDNPDVARLLGQVKRLVKTEARLNEAQRRLEAQTDRIGGLNEFVLRTARTFDSREIAAAALDLLLRIFPMERAMAVVVGRRQDTLYRVLLGGDFDGPDSVELSDQSLLKVDDGVSLPAKAYVIGDRRRCDATGPCAVAHYFRAQQSATEQRCGFCSFACGVCIPLTGKHSQKIGFLCAVRRSTVRGFHETLPSQVDVPFLELVRRHVEAALESARLHTQLEQAAAQLEARVDQRTAELNQVNERLELSLHELREAQDRLLEESRRAGMAEIATGVLHNVGNVLNSVTVGAEVINDNLSGSKLPGLRNALALTANYDNDLGRFLLEDARGKNFFPYLQQLDICLHKEQLQVRAEIEAIRRNVEHIRTIVSRQQAYARTAGVIEVCDPVQIIDDAIGLGEMSFERYGIEVTRRHGVRAPLLLDRHRVLQILINLLSNAKYAVCEGKRQDPRIDVFTELVDEDRFRIVVTDNGIGIAQENLDRIFTHGFSTKPSGHGFGLHNSALAAKEMGGSLACLSDGLSRGATFILELPFKVRAAA